MIDKLKRRTLKRMGVAAAATTSVAVSGGTLASDLVAANSKATVDAPHLPLADIQVLTRVSSTANDIEVVIRNAGRRSTCITQLTPSQTVTKRGRFDFSALLSNGDLTLAAGQSVVVPMQPHPVVTDASSSTTERANSLKNALRKSFSVITDNDAFACVSISNGIRFV